MQLKTLFKKIILIFFGLILSLFLLEVFLQSASFTIKYIKEFKTYHKYKKTKDKIIILCIGESTTSEMYPIQLQKVLNNISPNNFSVIDCGVPGRMLETISEEIEPTIKEYNPDIILFMMGINDGFYLSKEDENEIIPEDTNEPVPNVKTTKIKIYKLALLLKMHIIEFLKTKNHDSITTDKNTDEHTKFVHHIDSLLQHGKFTEAAQLLKKTLSQDPKNEYIYVTLTQLYCDFIRDGKITEMGYIMAIKGLDLDFIKDKTYLYKSVLEKYYNNKNKKLLKVYADKAVNESIYIFQSYYAHFIYSFIKDIISSEQKKRIFAVMMKSHELDKTYGVMAIENLKSGNYSKADKYFTMAEALRTNFPAKRTIRLYKSILKKSVDSKRKIICMQYPVRKIDLLKNMLKNEDYFNRITFVSNEETFKEALKKYDYSAIFSDQFAGDFGHCTDFGNTLIAQNAAKTIIEITNK